MEKTKEHPQDLADEHDCHFELTAQMKTVLDERLEEDEENHLTAEESIDRLRKKYER